MGNKDSKSASGSEKNKDLEILFSKISKGNDSIHRSELKEAWASQVDTHLYDLLENYLFGDKKDKLDFKTYSKLYTCMCTDGRAIEKSETLLQIMKRTENYDDSEITNDLLLKFIASTISSVLKVAEISKSKCYGSWSSRQCKYQQSSVERYSKFLIENIGKEDKSSFTSNDLQALLQEFDIYISILFSHLLKPDGNDLFVYLFPIWIPTPFESQQPFENVSVLDSVQIMFLNGKLPTDFQLEWRLLFSSSVHGESFSKLYGQISNKGPTIIIVEDKGGHVFGGFAPDSWSLGPKFLGNSSSFLFTLQPSMNIYTPSNFNDHYQYMNMGQQTIPNGLGMGGQYNYFGFWLDAEFGKGHCSENCTTFKNYKMMSSQKEFNVSHVEVWAVGPPPPTSEELGERSVLDSNLEVKAMLEMAGRKQHSEGLRDEPET